MCCRLASPNHQGVKNAVFLIEASSVLPADPHHRLPRQSQDQRGLSGGGREAREGSQQHHAGRLRSAWQDGPWWRRKEAVRNGKRKKRKSAAFWNGRPAAVPERSASKGASARRQKLSLKPSESLVLLLPGCVSYMSGSLMGA